MRRFLVLPILFWGLAGCAKKGEFAFFPADERDLSPLQARLYVPQRFRKLKPPISFPGSLSIYYIYRPGSPKNGDVYAMSLSKQSLGWVEVDLKNQRLDPSRGVLYDKLVGLEPGEYLLKIAYEDKVIDEIQFEIQPYREFDEPDYETDLASGNFDNDVDDIVLNSN